MTKNMTHRSRGDTLLYIPRVLDLPALLARKSHFLFGPRQTGKSFLIARALPGVRVYDLLDSTAYLALSQNPARLAQELTPQDRLVVIDEIQRLPDLLNEVHRLIETRGVRFLLTGSSARKLRRGGVNLLGGRARTRYLHPLIARELGRRFDLTRAVQCGTPRRSTSRTIRRRISRPTPGPISSRRSSLRGQRAMSQPSAGSFAWLRTAMGRSSTSPTSPTTPRFRARRSTSTSKSSRTRSCFTSCRRGGSR